MALNCFDQVEHVADVCVVGGGMAGLCAAVAAARHGAKTVLVQDRPVLGGNASSEVRMWICGAHGENNKETGILEEIQLDNARMNPGGNWSIWDAALWNKCSGQKNLTLLLNTAICDGGRERLSGDPSMHRLTHVRGWQLTTQTWHAISAKIFVDCSGDSVLAPISGALTRWGREARGEFDEDIQPEQSDRKTMGNTLLIQWRRVDEPAPFVSPPFAYRFDGPDDLPFRIHGSDAHNFWWLELGGLQDTIRDGERIRDDLMRVGWGVWDYIKNRSPFREEAAHWALEWLGSLPGKRENRRYVGGHVMTQNDVRAAGDPGYFADAVAYGGWSMDDHHPAGLLHRGQPTIFHPAPSPYVIPYRCLFSLNVSNLMMAGRNISVTHAALSSTRVMGTCALLGQAAGTAAALAVRNGISPAHIFPNHVPRLQQMLLEDDVLIPGRPRAIDTLSLGASCSSPQIINGIDRPIGEVDNAWTGQAGDGPALHWSQPHDLGAVRLIFDSNLRNDKRMPCRYPQRLDRSLVPKSLVRGFRVEARRADGSWQTIHRDSDNHQRFRTIPVQTNADALRLVIESTWGDTSVRVFGFEALRTDPARLPQASPRIAWSTIVAHHAPADDVQSPPPERSATAEQKKPRRVGA